MTARGRRRRCRSGRACSTRAIWSSSHAGGATVCSTTLPARVSRLFHQFNFSRAIADVLTSNGLPSCPLLLPSFFSHTGVAIALEVRDGFLQAQGLQPPGMVPEAFSPAVTAALAAAAEAGEARAGTATDIFPAVPPRRPMWEIQEVLDEAGYY